MALNDDVAGGVDDIGTEAGESGTVRVTALTGAYTNSDRTQGLASTTTDIAVTITKYNLPLEMRSDTEIGDMGALLSGNDITGINTDDLLIDGNSDQWKILSVEHIELNDSEAASLVTMRRT